MISKGTELTTFITGLNGGATVDPDLLSVLVATAKTILEEERPWVALRKVDTSIALPTSNTWTTAKSLTGITNFSRIYAPDGLITFFDGNNTRHYYRQAPPDRKLEYKDDNSRFWHDVNGNALYFGGTPPFAGTLYIPIIVSSADVDLTSNNPVWTEFPTRFLPLLGFYAIGVYKGAVDFDEITKAMLPENANVLQALKAAFEKWDDQLQENEIANNDPTALYTYPRGGAIDRYNR